MLEGLLTRKCRLAKYLLICFLCLVAPVGALKASKAYECTSCWATHPCHFRFIYSCKHSHKQCSFKYHKFLNCIQLVFNLLENPAMINWTKSGKTVIDLNQQCYPDNCPIGKSWLGVAVIGSDVGRTLTLWWQHTELNLNLSICKYHFELHALLKVKCKQMRFDIIDTSRHLFI